MKKLSIVGGILFALGMLVATGIDLNPIQAVYALVLIGAGAVCFSASEEQEADGDSAKTKSIKNHLEDAA